MDDPGSRSPDQPVTDTVARVARTFDALAVDYDQSGVAFFEPIAARLCALLAVQPGERVVEMGCGRGAATAPLALATGSSGSVTAVDVAPEMVALTRTSLERLPAPRAATSVDVMDASRPTLPEGSFDVLAASLVLFFLPDPVDGASRWLRLLRPGGRLGVATFGEQDETWLAVDALFRPHLAPGFLDPRTQGPGSPFASDAGVEELLRAAGAQQVQTVREPLVVAFDDAEQWRTFSMSTGQRALWGFVPEDRRPSLFAEAAELLESARGDDGRIVVRQDVRCTVAHV